MFVGFFAKIGRRFDSLYFDEIFFVNYFHYMEKSKDRLIYL